MLGGILRKTVSYEKNVESRGILRQIRIRLHGRCRVGLGIRFGIGVGSVILGATAGDQSRNQQQRV